LLATPRAAAAAAAAAAPGGRPARWAADVLVCTWHSALSRHCVSPD